jgi:hypothetical protein
VKLPSAVLTIRGTTTEGNCDSTGCIVVLSGTGDQNSAGKKPSQILIESDKGSKVLKRTGFFVLISPDGTITEPERLDEEAASRLAGLFDPLVGPGEGGYLGGKQLVDASGQPTADGTPFVEDIDDLYGDPQLQDLGYESTSNLPSGQLTFSGTGIDIAGPPSAGAGGAYSFLYSLDLGSREFNGLVTFNAGGTTIGTINGSFALQHNPFNDGFTNITEGGPVLDTPNNDVISVHYTFGPNQIDTSWPYGDSYGRRAGDADGFRRRADRTLAQTRSSSCFTRSRLQSAAAVRGDRGARRGRNLPSPRDPDRHRHPACRRQCGGCRDCRRRRSGRRRTGDDRRRRRLLRADRAQGPRQGHRL